MYRISRTKDAILASRARILIAALVVMIVLVGAVALLVSPKATTPPTATLRVAKASNRTMDYEIGFDHAPSSPLFGGGNTAAVANAKSLLSSLKAPQSVQLMDSDMNDPEPIKGAFTFENAGLDNRVNVMAATTSESERIITLSTAPGWMKNSTDADTNSAPTAAHYADFAALSAAVAARYDGKHLDSNGKLLPKVDAFSVWNGLKGFSLSNGDFDAKSYTTMYNDVYTAIKAVRPDAKVGGPYVGINVDDPTKGSKAYGSIRARSYAAMDYWLQNKKGADFIAMDGGPQLRSGYLATNGYLAGDMFADAATYIRGLSNITYPGARTLPLWWTDFYPATNGTNKDGQATGQQAVSIAMDNFRKAGQAGISKTLLPEPAGTATDDNSDTHIAAWTDTSQASGGQATAFYTALKGLHDNFPVGTLLYKVTTSNSLVQGLASKNKIMLIVRGNQIVTVKLAGQKMMLNPYEVRFVNR